VWFWRFDAKAGKPVGERKNITNARFDTGNAIVRRRRRPRDGGGAQESRQQFARQLVAHLDRAAAVAARSRSTRSRPYAPRCSRTAT
jgi:hypothetical protein